MQGRKRNGIRNDEKVEPQALFKRRDFQRPRKRSATDAFNRPDKLGVRNTARDVILRVSIYLIEELPVQLPLLMHSDGHARALQLGQVRLGPMKRGIKRFRKARYPGLQRAFLVQLCVKEAEGEAGVPRERLPGVLGDGFGERVFGAVEGGYVEGGGFLDGDELVAFLEGGLGGHSARGGVKGCEAEV